MQVWCLLQGFFLHPTWPLPALGAEHAVCGLGKPEAPRNPLLMGQESCSKPSVSGDSSLRQTDSSWSQSAFKAPCHSQLPWDSPEPHVLQFWKRWKSWLFYRKVSFSLWGHFSEKQTCKWHICPHISIYTMYTDTNLIPCIYPGIFFLSLLFSLSFCKPNTDAALSYLFWD